MTLNLTLKMKSRLLSLSKIGVGSAASVGLGWLAARGLDWSLVRDSFANVSVSMLTLGVVVFVASTYLRAYRWQLLFVDETISTYRLFIIQNVGTGLNNVMPIRIACEAAQLAILTLRDRIRPSTALATLGMERVIDVIASALIIAVAFFLIPEMNSFTLYAWSAVGFMIVSVGLERLLAWGSTVVRAIRRIPALAAFADAVRELEQHLLVASRAFTGSQRVLLAPGGHLSLSRQSRHFADDGDAGHRGNYILCHRGAGGAICNRHIRVRNDASPGDIRNLERSGFWIRGYRPCRVFSAAYDHGRRVPAS